MGQLKTGCELTISDSFQNTILRFKPGSESGSKFRSESECGSTSGSEFESESKSRSESLYSRRWSLVYVDQTLTVAATSCDSFKPAWHFTL